MVEWYQWVAANRKHRGLSEKQLAELIGVNARSVWNWERRVYRPDRYARGKLAELFGEMPG